MTTGLTTSGGVDFDSCFQTGSGNQLLYIYTNSGVDIGQKYLNVSNGSAYGSTGFYASDGKDIGSKLCKIGSNGISATVKYSKEQSSYTTGSGESAIEHYYYYSQYALQNISKTPYWEESLHVLKALNVNNNSGTGTGSWKTTLSVGWQSNNYVSISSIIVTNHTNNTTATLSSNATKHKSFTCSGDPLGIKALSGNSIQLSFSPAPTGYL